MTNFIAISEARANLPTIVDKVAKYLERFLITVNGKPKAAVLSLEELESLEETAKILSIPGGRESIKRGLRQAKNGQGVLLEKILKN